MNADHAINPELKRQLWLQFSPARLVVLPLMILALMLGLHLTLPDRAAMAIALASGAIFVVLVFFAGTRAAGASVTDELNDHTWDQQRMSAMSPWSMAWGKLAGSTSYAWYIGGWCIAIGLIAVWVGHLTVPALRMVMLAVLVGVFLQALLLTIHLQLVYWRGAAARRGSATAILLVLVWVGFPLTQILRIDTIQWWGFAVDTLNFLLLSMGILVVCVLVAAWRSMAEILMVRQWPWGWPALAIAVTLYLCGFAPTNQPLMLVLIGLATCVVMSYFSLFAEPQTRAQWQRVLARSNTGQWRLAIQLLPRWPSTVVLALPLALLASASTSALGEIDTVFLQKWMHYQPLCMFLLMLRDSALALYFSFSVKSRNPQASFATTLLVLHGLLPWLLSGVEPTTLPMLAQPILSNHPGALVVALVHGGIAFGLLRWRWNLLPKQ